MGGQNLNMLFPQVNKRPPVSLGCGHTICRTCLDNLQRRQVMKRMMIMTIVMVMMMILMLVMMQCPFDQTAISCDLALLPVNTALLQLIGPGPGSDDNNDDDDDNDDDHGSC